MCYTLVHVHIFLLFEQIFFTDPKQLSEQLGTTLYGGPNVNAQSNFVF